MQTYKHFSRNSLVVIYLLLRALRKGVDRVKLTESFFRSFFDLELPARLYDAYIRKFAYSVKPFFPDYDLLVHGLMLYVKERDKTNKYYKSLLRKMEGYKSHQTIFKSNESFLMQTEIVESLPEIDEELIAIEVAKCISNYISIKRIIS